jgi:hypothetical protein
MRLRRSGAFPLLPRLPGGDARRSTERLRIDAHIFGTAGSAEKNFCLLMDNLYPAVTVPRPMNSPIPDGGTARLKLQREWRAASPGQSSASNDYRVLP